MARYANWWNSGALDRATFRARSARLDQLLRAAGRQPGDVRRTMMRAVYFGRDPGAVERRLRGRLRPELAGQPFAAALETLRREERTIVGTPEDAIGQINRLKVLKRQMYGRAKLDLLEKRFLYAA